MSGCWGPGGTAEKPNRCWYCYAEKLARRFPSRNPGDTPDNYGDPFRPTFHPERLDDPNSRKKRSKIFVCSMADLFGDWVPERWIGSVLNFAKATPQHTFQFLTKNPKRLKDFNPWPSNCWVGCTVTNQVDADERLPWLLQMNAPVRFVSHEPLLSDIDVRPWIGDYMTSPAPGQRMPNWAILGALTGPGAAKHRPDPAWVQGLIDQYRAAGVPVFVKDNLQFLMGLLPGEIQEWPLPRADSLGAKWGRYGQRLSNPRSERGGESGDQK